MYSSDQLTSQGFTDGPTAYPAPSQYDNQTFTLPQNQSQAPQNRPAQPYVPGQAPPNAYPPQQYQPPATYGKQTVTQCCGSKFMKYFVIFSVYFVGIVLMGLVGVMCPWLLIVREVVEMVPYLLFSAYCLFVFF
jgi:hypothetical protein